jgi:hypothetical protein
MSHDECPMGIALKEKRALAAEILGERPDGTRVPLLAYPTPNDVGNRVWRATPTSPNAKARQ